MEDFSQFRTRLVGSLSKQLVKVETLRMRAVKGLFDHASLDQADNEITSILEKPERKPRVA